MSVEIVPFAADHLDAAAALLAARHRRDRAWIPGLSRSRGSRCRAADPARAADRRRKQWRGGPARRPCRRLPPGRIRIPFAHRCLRLLSRPAFQAIFRTRQRAADPADGASLYPRLYAVLAQEWVRQGVVGHYVTVPASPDTAEPWWDLGFGRFSALSARATTPAVEHAPDRGMEITLRRAGQATQRPSRR